MADIKFKPVHHDHKAFVEKASKREGFVEAYDALALEYQLDKPDAQDTVPAATPVAGPRLRAGGGTS